MSAWLLKHDFQGGETCDAGLSHATPSPTTSKSAAAPNSRRRWRQSRSRDEVLKARRPGHPTVMGPFRVAASATRLVPRFACRTVRNQYVGWLLEASSEGGLAMFREIRSTMSRPP